MGEHAAQDETLTGLMARLMAEGAADAPRPPAPVERWSPQQCGDIDILIKADGTWLHEGRPIVRPALVRLFASILRKDADGCTYLVTPGEMARIRVEDAPFLAVRAERTGAGADQTIAFVTNLGETVALDANHPLRVAVNAETGEPRPYVLVRGRLEARIVRAAYYDLAEWAVEGPGGLGVWSGGQFWPLAG